MLYTTNKFVQSISAQITSKCHEDDVSQPIQWEIFSVLLTACSLLMCCFQLIHHLTSYIPPRVTEKSQEAGTALIMLGALH